jgi:DNA-binding NtrC family response regulator
MDGLETLSRLRGMNDALPVVIVSAHGTASTALEAGRLGAFRFIEKPLSKDYVLDAIREGPRARLAQARETGRCGRRSRPST